MKRATIFALGLALALWTVPSTARRKKTKPVVKLPDLKLFSPFGPGSVARYRIPYGGSNLSCAERSTFCRRCRSGGRRGHKGVDLDAKIGTKVYPVYPGVINHLRRTDGGKLGIYVVVRFPMDCLDKATTCLYATYAHLNEVYDNIKSGTVVMPHTPLGETGKSGNAKRLSPKQHHLHLEVSTYPGFLKERVNPALFMSISGNEPQNNVGCRILDGVIRRNRDKPKPTKASRKLNRDKKNLPVVSQRQK